MKLFKRFLAIMALVVPALGIIPVQAEGTKTVTITVASITAPVIDAVKRIENSDMARLGYNTASILYQLGKGTIALGCEMFHHTANNSIKVKEIFEIVGSSRALTTIFIIGGLYTVSKLYQDYYEYMNSKRKTTITYTS